MYRIVADIPTLKHHCDTLARAPERYRPTQCPRSDDFWAGESRSDSPLLLLRLRAYLFPFAFLHRATALVRLGLAADGLAAVVGGPFSLCNQQPPDSVGHYAAMPQHLPPLGAMATGAR